MKETYPLQWPSDVIRTRPQDRIKRVAWKRTDKQAVDQLDDELQKFDAFGVILTRKDPSDRMTALDPSIAVYFSRREKIDFGWQDALGISDPAPSIDDVNRSFRELAKRYHPDVCKVDADNMVKLNQHRDNAMRYIRQLTGAESQSCISCDKFELFRWNVQAVSNTIRSLRQMQRDGTSGLVDRAMQGFAAPQLKEARDVITASA